MGTLPTYLAIDLGTSAVKAACIDQDGRSVGSATVEYALRMLPAGRVECDPETYWNAVVEAVRAARRAAETADTRVSVSTLALTCQAETLLCLDGAGRPLRPAIVWLDNRSGTEAIELGERLGVRTIHARTGQMVSLSTSPASKILWLSRHEPEVVRATSTFCLIGDWIVRRLTGLLAGDITTYSTSLLLDLDRRVWWTVMLELLELTPRQLVTLADPGSALGTLDPAAAEAIGLDRRARLVSGAMDTIAGAVGAANLAPGSLTEATGTYLAPLTCFDTLPPFSDPGFPSLLHAVPRLYCAVPYGQTAGAVLRWLHDLMSPAEGLAGRERDYASLIAEAEHIPPGCDGVTFLPHLAGAGYPDWDLDSSAAIAGMRLGHGRGHVVRAALESVAFMLRGAIDGLCEAGARIDRVTSIGPASRSSPWLQIKADVCQLPIARLEEDQASLLGAAMLAAVACGDRADLTEAASAMTRVAQVIDPNPALAGVYAAAYARYRSLYPRLRQFGAHGAAEAGHAGA